MWQVCSWSKPLWFAWLFCLLLWFNGLLLCIYMLKIVKKLLWGKGGGCERVQGIFERLKEICLFIILVSFTCKRLERKKLGWVWKFWWLSCVWNFDVTSPLHFIGFGARLQKNDKYGLFKENTLETFLIFSFISWIITSLSMKLGFFDVSLHGRWKSH